MFEPQKSRFQRKPQGPVTEGVQVNEQVSAFNPACQNQNRQPYTAQARSPGRGRPGRDGRCFFEQGPGSGDGGELPLGAAGCGSGACRAGERDLAIRSEELESALACGTLAVAELTEQGSQPTPTELPRDVAELRALLALERRDLEHQKSQWERERERLTQQAVEARARQLAAERLLKASEERYRRGRERAREQGRASAYSESVLASSSQHERNVQDATGAQRSTGSRVPMGPPPPPTTAADLGEAESSRREPATPAEGGDESQTTPP
ncbi:hypothetical protein Taro_048032 [Colocasia esculenta]|uniref:Uncharacterized protein n=1 Tax=Colocasia esculenta TaxID=4460 RepID=A0A843X1Z9_COLES|nr:hypothetical protein [Colocasia esculenta]